MHIATASPCFITRRRGEERKDAHTSGVVASRIVSRTYERSARPEKKRERGQRREVGTPLSVGIPYEEKDRRQHREQQPFFRHPSPPPDHAFSTYRHNCHNIVPLLLASSTLTYIHIHVHIGLCSITYPACFHPPRRPRHFRVESIENLIDGF